MKEWSRRNESGIQAVAITAALLALIGLWCAFVGWSADRTHAPVPVNGIVSDGGASVGEDAGIALSRRIIVYQSVEGGGEGDTAEG